MGNAKFYFFGLPDARFLTTIDLGEKLGELFTENEYDSVQTISRAGRRYLSQGLKREFVTIQRDRMILGEDLAIKLQSMQNHLDRGGYVSFCADSDKAYLHPSLSPTEQNTTQFNAGTNPFKEITGTNTPSSNDYVVIETDSPSNIQEYNKVSAISSGFSSSGGVITLENNSMFTIYSRIFLRYYRFFPVLRRDVRDIGQSIITNEGGRLFSLNLRLYVDTYTLFSFHPGTDGIDISPNFSPNSVPFASGGSNEFILGEKSIIGNQFLNPTTGDIATPELPETTVNQI